MLPLNRLLEIGVRSFKESDALCTTAANLVTRRTCHGFPFSWIPGITSCQSAHALLAAAAPMFSDW